MMYKIVTPKHRFHLNMNHIVEFQRKKNPENLEDERVRIELIGDVRHVFRGQDALDFVQVYNQIILPALGGVINP